MKRGSFYAGQQFWDDMEFVWEGEGGRGGGGGGGLIAHVLWNGYASGKWLDWEHLPGFMTRKLAKSVGRRIVEEVKERCKRRRSKHVMFMWGNDNRFIQAGNQFSAMDQVISALQEMKDETGFDARYRLRGCEVYFSNGFRVHFCVQVALLTHCTARPLIILRRWRKNEEFCPHGRFRRRRWQ